MYAQSQLPAVDDLANLATKIARGLFGGVAQQEACKRHLSRLLAECKEPLNPKLLRALRQEAVALTMQSPR